MKKRKKPISQIRAIALLHGVTERTVRYWKADGAPISDAKRLSAWLASRRQPPRTATTSSRAGAIAPVSSNAPITAQNPAELVVYKTGAASALKRLEAQEVSDYRQLETAMQGGDELQIRLARDRWLRTSESLRKYDLAIEQARRDSGELVPREEMERLCYELNEALYFALLGLQDVSPSIIGMPVHEVAKLLNRIRGTVFSAVLSYISRPQRKPLLGWMVKAVRLGQFPPSKDTDEECIQFWFVIREAMKEQAQQARAAWDKLAKN